jgi:high-affinity nickel-transport protein
MRKRETDYTANCPHSFIEILMAISDLILLFALGLRHGLDPDHIACIDGLTWRAVRAGRRHARWIGTLFALGHGLLVTVMAVVISMIPIRDLVSPQFWSVMEWVPTLLLIVVGVLNLRAMRPLQPNEMPQNSWRYSLIPKSVLRHTSPLAIFFVGVLFAAVFDTATQMSTLGYVSSSPGASSMNAIYAGLVFTIGMMTTDTLDSQMIGHISRSADRPEAVASYRRKIGWAVVLMAFAVAIYNVIVHFNPDFEVSDDVFSIIGGSFVLGVFLFAAALRFRTPRLG